MAKKNESTAGAVERAWPFDVGQKVATDQGGGVVVWRRESSAGKRDYEVLISAGRVWLPEGSISKWAK